MKDLKTLLDEKSLDQIKQELSQFVHSADGYANRLKITYALLYLINDGCALLKTIDLNSFISDIRKRIEDIESQSGSLKETYDRHLAANKNISAVLASPSDNKLTTQQKEIEKLHREYDGMLKELLERREKLSIEGQLKEKGHS